jgi:hypothetical protein
MRRPRRVNPSQVPVSRSYSAPAPVGGWNARDSLADMAADDAVILDNWIPGTDKCSVRKGHASHATGLTSAVESLMAYHPPTGTAKLFAAANSAVFDATASGAVGAAQFSSLTNVRFQHVNFGNSAGNFLYIVNGDDAPRYWNGSSWTSPTITGSGLTSTNLIHINVHKRRLFFVEKNTLSFWYFPVETIAGSITEFRLDGLAQLGGHLVAMGTWTRDSGEGIDDLAVFLTSKGEAIVYQGTNPGDAAAWALVGVFRIGAPIGRRCMFKVGAELIVVTEDGYAPISKAIAGARTTDRAAISDKIGGAVTKAVSSHKASFGWQPILYPGGKLALFNVPVKESVTSVQHVVNTTTGKWCRFTGMNANVWEVFNDSLYFGGAAKVFKADTGRSDAGGNIDTAAKTAFDYFGSKGLIKRFLMARPILSSQGQISLALAANVDYRDDPPTATPTYSGSAGSPWDTSPWDTSAWGGDAGIRKEWQGVNGAGHSAALYIKSSTKGLDLNWVSTDWIYESGGFL